MDCPDACSLIVSQDEAGFYQIRGNPFHPVTSGFICPKIKDHFQRLQSSHRIVRPIIRAGKQWKTIDWNSALDLCSEKIQNLRKEPASILHFRGEGAKGVLKEATRLFFSRLGASRVRGSLCDAAGYVAYLMDFGSRHNNYIKDLLNAKKIINWGKNPSRSSIHLAAILRKSRSNRARIISISPGGDQNESHSDAIIRIRPGTDRFLAAAVIRLFIERGMIDERICAHAANWIKFRKLILQHPLDQLSEACDVRLEDIKKIFFLYANPDATATLVGAGLQRYTYGGENIRFINALAMISGNIGRSGGGSYFHLSSLRNLNLDWMKTSQTSCRSFLMPLIGSQLLQTNNPPVKLIWINGSNVINQAPDSRQIVKAFEKIDFKVVVDAFMTDTAERADLLLPSTLMLEQEDIISSYLHDYIHYISPVLKAPGEAKDDFWILSELGKRLNPPIVLPDSETCLRASLKSPYLEVSLEELRKTGFVKAKRSQIAYEGLRFDHPDKKCRFPTILHEEPPVPPTFPLRLLSLIRGDAIHSQILPHKQQIPPILQIAPDNPCLADIDTNKEVYIVSCNGKLKVKLELLPGLHPSAVIYRRGDWMKFGGGINQLVSEGLTDIGNGAPFYDQYIRLENG
jgi:anaerobic selenocysteine-containing dehydrogenase